MKKILKSGEIKRCVKWFIYFWNPLWVGHVWQTLGREGLFGPPHPPSFQKYHYWLCITLFTNLNFSFLFLKLILMQTLLVMTKICLFQDTFSLDWIILMMSNVVKSLFTVKVCCYWEFLFWLLERMLKSRVAYTGLQVKRERNSYLFFKILNPTLNVFKIK